MSEHKTDELHSAIMNLPCKVPTIEASNGKHDLIWASGYKLGHRDARHAAAELVCAAIPQAVSAEPQWLPIESAPKDGYVLIFCPFDIGDPLVAQGCWSHFEDGGWIDWNGDMLPATHWMPLPPAPKEPQ